MDWDNFFEHLRRSYEFHTQKPVSSDLVKKTLRGLDVSYPELEKLYTIANGLSAEWFTLFPVEDPQNLKKTWNGIQWANSIEKTPYLQRNADLLRRFLVFAEIGGGKVAVIDRGDGSIWFEEDGKLSQTDLRLEEFIELSLKKVSELS